MKKLSLIIVALFCLGVFTFALQQFDTILPIANRYWITGGTINDNLTFSFNVSPNSTMNALNCTLWANNSGTWGRISINSTFGTKGVTTLYSFAPEMTNFTTTDNLVYKFGAQCCDNSSCLWSENRTIYVESSPTITKNLPANNTFSQSRDNTLNITVSGDDSEYICYFYANDTTANWTQRGGFFTPTNGTASITAISVGEKSLVWNVKCFEKTKYANVYGWSTTNFTLTVDETNPAVSIISPADDSYSHLISNGSAIITLNVTDANAGSCILKVNGTSNFTKSYTSGTPFTFTLNATDGNYEWNTICNDSSGRTTETSNYTITLDSVMPTLNRNVNYSLAGSCSAWTVEFNFSEAVNYTVLYGEATTAMNSSVSSAAYQINQTVRINFSTYETTYYINLTNVCDRGGNCNNTLPQFTAVSPAPLCSGWSMYSIYVQNNLSEIYNQQTNIDYLYWWNSSSQSWLYYTTSDTTYQGTKVSSGDVVQFNTDTDETWFRNISSIPTKYNINITSGFNYLPMYQTHSIGNFSDGIFRNASTGNFTPQSKQFQIDYFAVFNNSAKTWVSAIYGWGENNGTVIGGTPKRYLDTISLYSDYNLSINVTTGGYVYGNWT